MDPERVEHVQSDTEEGLGLKQFFVPLSFFQSLRASSRSLSFSLA